MSYIENTQLLEAVTKALSIYIDKNSTKAVFNHLLDSLLKLTNSEYGFIGQTYFEPDKTPYLKTHAITDISWNEETRKFYEENAPSGLEFRNLDTLFGVVLRDRSPVISNSPDRDPRAGGRPPGHPALNCFLGIPFFLGQRFLGMVGIANRPGGYNEAIIEELAPFLAACSQIISSWEDNQGRKAATIALQKEKRRLELVLEGTRLGFWDWYPQTNEVQFNERWAEMLGYNISEIEHKLETWSEKVHPDDLDDCMADISAHMEGRTQFYENVHRMKHKEGHWVYILDRGKIVEWNKEGMPLRFTGTHTDITKEKENEEKAIKASKAKTDFLSNMSHEIRTPLNGVIGSVQLIKDTNLDEDQKLIVQQMQSSSNLLLNLVDDILDINKIDEGKLKIENAPFSLMELINVIRESFESSFHAKEVEFNIEFNKDSTNYFTGDQKRLGQIIINLVGNALKFTSEGSVNLSLIYNDKDSQLNVSVKDTGVGISTDRKDHIFEHFTQEDESISRRFGGSGLGLSLCKNLIALMGGTIDVDSKEGEGSTFYFSIPLKACDQKQYASIAEEDFDNIKGTKVLVVEDNLINQSVAKKILENIGCVVSLASDGESAIRYCNENSPDLILMDLHMPGMDGYEATKSILNNHLKDKLLPIVALSADVLVDSKEACFKAGMVDFLSKPFTKNAIIALVSNLKKQGYI